MINSKQRSYLRSLANTLEPIFQIGKGGITEEFSRQISNALEARELIKISVLDNSDTTAKDAASDLAAFVNADVVLVIGRKIVLYRESENNKRIEL